MIHVKDSLLARVNFWFLDFRGKNMSHLCRKDGQIPLQPLPCQRFTWNSPEKKGMSLFLSNKYVFFPRIYTYIYVDKFPFHESLIDSVSKHSQTRWFKNDFKFIFAPFEKRQKIIVFLLGLFRKLVATVTNRKTSRKIPQSPPFCPVKSDPEKGMMVAPFTLHPFRDFTRKYRPTMDVS